MVFCTRAELDEALATPDLFGISLKQSACEAAGDFIETRTEDQWYRQTGVAKTFDGNGKRLLEVMPSLHAVTAVVITDPFDNSTDSLDSNEHTFGRGWIRLRGPRSYFTTGNSNISITGNWGRINAPPMLKIISIRLAIAILGGKSPADVVEETLGNYSVTYMGRSGPLKGADMEATTIEDLLLPYMLHPISMERVRGERRTLRDYETTPREELGFE